MANVHDHDEALQFDRAEYEGREETANAAAPAVPCGGCGRSIADSYYKVNAEVVCRECHDKAVAARGPGGGVGRFLRAGLFGVLAGAVGAVLYYAVLALTGYEVGLIAIVVGFLVGIAVQIGSRRRGGWLYQGLAMAITYVAIVTTYVPFVLEELRTGIADANLQTSAVEPGSSVLGEAVSDLSDGSDGSDLSDLSDESDTVPAAIAAPAAADELGTAGEVLLVAAAFVVALVAPVLMGFDNILGLIIIGIGLYEAWKLNQRPPFATEGPFQVGAQPA